MKMEVKKILTVARYTFVEIYKSRILINVLFLGIALIFISYIASEFSYIASSRVAIDFGLGAMTIAGLGIAIFMGVNLIYREVESRTIYMILSNPIRRFSFLMGKIIGMSGILLINTLILGAFAISFYIYLGGVLDTLLVTAVFFSFLESVLMLLFVVLFSLITNVVMSVVFAVAVYILGHVIHSTMLVTFVKNNALFGKSLKIFSLFFPNLSNLNVKDYVIYKQYVSLEYVLKTSLCTMIYMVILIIIISMIFNRKNLD